MRLNFPLYLVIINLFQFNNAGIVRKRHNFPPGQFTKLAKFACSWFETQPIIRGKQTFASTVYEMSAILKIEFEIKI